MTPEIRERFTALYSHIKREGAKELLEYLSGSTYFSDPASARNHDSCECGLCIHSMNVTDNIVRLSRANNLYWKEPDSPYIIGLGHDVCKIGCYAVEYRNRKNEMTGQWEKYPYYVYRDLFPIAEHSAKSVIILSRYIKLTDEETACIAHHMGAYGLQDTRTLSEAIQTWPNVLWTQVADQLSCVEGV